MKPKRRRAPRKKPVYPVYEEDGAPAAKVTATDTLDLMSLDHPHSHPNWVGKHPIGTHKYFDSVREYVDYAHKHSEERKEARAYRGNGQLASRDKHRGEHWDLGIEYDGAVELSHTGWADGAAKVEELLDKVEQEIRRYLPEQRQAIVSTMAEGAFCTPAYLAGHPFMFRKVQKIASVCKTVTLVYETSASCGVDAETMMRKGVAVAAVVQALEKRRVRCEVIAMTANGGAVRASGRYLDVGAAIKVKAANERLALDDIAFVLAHPALHRRISFAYMEAVAYRLAGEIDYGYGHPDTFHWQDGAIVVGSRPCYSDEEMQAYVKTQLDAILGERR